MFLVLLWNAIEKAGLFLDAKEIMFQQGKKKFLFLIAEDEKEFRGISSAP